MPRLVFGGAPTIQEVEQAISELNDALQRIYPSPNNTQRLEDSVPNPTLEAFRFLKENPDVQNVVALLLSDPNVWDAVTQNNAFNDFFQKYQTTVALPTLSDWLVYNKIPRPEIPGVALPNTWFECSVQPHQKKGRKGFCGKLLDMMELLFEFFRAKFLDMMELVFEFFRGLFAGRAAKHLRKNGDGTFAKKAAFETTLMTLVTMVIMAIILKPQQQS